MQWDVERWLTGRKYLFMISVALVLIAVIGFWLLLPLQAETSAGRSPQVQIEKMAGRIDVIHFKDMKMHGHEQRFAAVMDGNMDFKSIIEACEKTGIQYAMIEQDNCYDRSPFDELKLSAENLLRAGCTF